jgi:flagellar P-ring protein precursor FlgI
MLEKMMTIWKKLRTALKNILVFSALLMLIANPVIVMAERLKDITTVSGVRENALIGYGLVVGLNGTGDQTTQTPFTTQSFRNMLTQLGVVIPETTSFQLKNVAAVTVQAKLPAFAKPGQTIDVTVSSIGNAKSLMGGALLMSPLKGADGTVYAVAQGDLIGSGFDAEGADGSSITVNVPTDGRIPNGATVEREINGYQFSNTPSLTFNLRRSDFTTAKRVVKQINDTFGPDVAQAIDGMSIKVTAPLDANERVEFLSVLEGLEVQEDEAPARIVINSRTGTIVVGNKVTISPVAVTHGNLTVVITEDEGVSQPNAFAGGRTERTVQSTVDVDQGSDHMWSFKGSTTLDELVRAVNNVGAAPGDLMAIIQALKQVGALKAEVIVI